jgi:iron(III) transport system ATP-binding protein
MLQPPPALSLDQVYRRLGNVAALDGVSLTLGEGEIVCLVGHSGCGKSTLLRAIAGVEQIDAGTISLVGRVVTNATTFVEPEHRNVGFMFQDYALFPHLTARANIGFGLRSMEARQRGRRIAETIDKLGIASLADRYPHQLSGGEQQRVALARALAPQPSVLLMDEPFSNLDPGLRASIRQETLTVIRALGITAVIVTHDPEEALSTGDSVALMHKGRIVERGTGEAVYTRPRTPYAASFFSQVNRIPARRLDDRVETVLGAFPLPSSPSAEVEVLLRPQSLHLAAQGVPATVLRRTFLGEMEELQLSVDGLAHPLILRSSRRSGVSEGQSVELFVARDEALVFSVDLHDE